MSYPHIDPNTYLRLQEQEFGKSPVRYGPARFFAVGSRASVFFDKLRSAAGSGLGHIRTALLEDTSKNNDFVAGRPE